MRISIVGLAVGLSFVATPAEAYWIRHCQYSPQLGSQTSMVADINPGAPDAANILFGFSARHHLMAHYKGMLYFQADDGQSGAELWRVVGGAPPSRVEDFAPGQQGSGPHAFAVFKGTLYFAASTQATGEELFGYDGTSISLAAEMAPGPDGGEIAALTEYDGALYFTRVSPTSGHKVWRFDGATAEPVAAINVIPGTVSDSSAIAQPFVVFKGRLYFVKVSPLPEHYELWAYNGSAGVKIKGLTSGQNIVSYTFGMGTYQGFLYFGVVAPGPGQFEQDELWRYGGNPGDVPGKLGTLPGNAFTGSQPGDFQVYKGRLYFGAGEGFFRVVGFLIQNLTGGPGGSPYYARGMSLFPAADRLYLTGFHDEVISTEPYTFDGTVAHLLKNIMPDDASDSTGSYPTSAVEVGGDLYFYAKNDAYGRELWRVSGAGIGLLKCDIVVAPIWDDWREWIKDRRDVVMATWLLETGVPPRLLSREVTTVARGKETRLSVLEADARRQPLPEGFALATIVFDRETGTVVDRGFDIVGSPGSRVGAGLKRSAAALVTNRTLRQVMTESVRAYKDGASVPSKR